MPSGIRQGVAHRSDNGLPGATWPGGFSQRRGGGRRQRRRCPGRADGRVRSGGKAARPQRQPSRTDPNTRQTSTANPRAKAVTALRSGVLVSSASRPPRLPETWIRAPRSAAASSAIRWSTSGIAARTASSTAGDRPGATIGSPGVTSAVEDPAPVPGSAPAGGAEVPRSAAPEGSGCSPPPCAPAAAGTAPGVAGVGGERSAWHREHHCWPADVLAWQAGHLLGRLAPVSSIAGSALITWGSRQPHGPA